jgi:flagellar hook-associated protein 3 FlgL
LATALNQPVMQAQSALASASVESTTGQYSDLGRQLGDQSGYELSLRNETQILQTLTSANNIVSTNLEASQNALESIRSNAQSTLESLATWTSGINSGAILQNLGVGALQSLTSATNTTSNGQYVFAGINSDVAPMTDYFSSPASPARMAIDQAFQAAFGTTPDDASASAISVTDLRDFLEGPFAAQFQGSAWTDNWSSASSVNTSSEIAPGQTIDTSVNANQPGFQALAQAYAMLSEFGGSKLSQDAQQLVASTAASLITQGLNSITSSQAVVGMAQQKTSDANDSMSSQITILQTQIGSLDNVDLNATATRISMLTTQIQTAYELTSRLHQMSLAQYLPVA